jgi:hypothetical protein
MAGGDDSQYYLRIFFAIICDRKAIICDYLRSSSRLHVPDWCLFLGWWLQQAGVQAAADVQHTAGWCSS